MKKFPLLFVIFSTAFYSFSQDFKPFKVDLAIGAAIPQGSGSSGGFLFAIEPKYAVSDKFSVGLRFEGALTAVGVVTSAGTDQMTTSGDISYTGSYVVTGDYYLSQKKFRPFVGGGIGIYKPASIAFSDSQSQFDISLSTKSKFGGMIRTGFEFGHLRFGIEYNLVGKTSYTFDDVTVTAKNGYLGIKLGFFFGGGRK